MSDASGGGRFGRTSWRHLGRVGRGQRAVKAPALSMARGFLRSSVGRASTLALPPCGADGRAAPRPSACESFALALLGAPGTSREFWRASLSNVPLAGSRDRGPFQSHPAFGDQSCRHWSSPSASSGGRTPAWLVLPTPPRLLTTRTAGRSSLSLGHCPGPVVSRSRPRGVQTRPERVTSLASVEGTKRSRSVIAHRGA